MTEFINTENLTEESLLSKQTLCDQIYELLKSDIVHRRIAFGERLINRDLQKRFGVSSTPIRDAVNRLYQDGLVETITNNGTKVIALDLAFVLDSNTLVSILSQGTVDLIVHAGRLGELADRLGAVVEQQSGIHTVDDYVRSDKAFHQAFFDCCGNRQLETVFQRYDLWMEILVRLAAFGRNDQQERFAQHERIFESCRRGDVAAIRSEIALHYDLSAEWFTSHTEELGLKNSKNL